MAGGGGPPSSWGDPNPGFPDNVMSNQRIDGSYTGPILSSFMDAEQQHGELMLLRLRGVDGRPLPSAPFLIRKSIQAYLGSSIDGAFPEAGGSSYALKVRNRKAFQKLLEFKKLSDDTPVEVIEHPVLNMVRCVVTCRDVVEMPEDELKEELAEQGVIEVRRITRKEGDKRVNTPTLILSFRGTCFPQSVYFGFVHVRPRPYYPSPMQCFNC